MGRKRIRIMEPFAGEVPKCADRDAYQSWRNTARAATGIQTQIGFCLDCTPEHAALKRKAGTCERPSVRFRTDTDGMVEGYFPFAEEVAA